MFDKSPMGLIDVVRKEIMKEVIIPNTLIKGTNKKYNRIMVVDNLGMKILSTCYQLYEIIFQGIILIEDLFKLRQKYPKVEAVYLITPNEKSIAALISDFAIRGKPMYKTAHVYLLMTCPGELFKDLRKSRAAKKIETFIEIDLAFIPYERQVFSLDAFEMFQYFYNPFLLKSGHSNIDFIAQQIATVCVTLEEYPSVRYRSSFHRTHELALAVQQKIAAYKIDYPNMGESIAKSRSQLIILDRGFDCVSPILHELTYQAMAYDILSIDNNIYKYSISKGDTKSAWLEENDDVWVELRHEHIAEVTKNMTAKLKKFVDQNRVSSITEGKCAMRNLLYTMKKVPQCYKDLEKYSAHLSLSENCITRYSNNLKSLYGVEQDLAMAEKTEGRKSGGQLMNFLPILVDPNVPKSDKIRIIILYILHKNGILEENLDKLIEKARLSQDDKQTIVNLHLLGIKVLVKNIHERKKKQYQVPRKYCIKENTYQHSRWIPVIKGIIQCCITNDLDCEHFPFVNSKDVSTEPPLPLSARYGNRLKYTSLDKKLSKIIIFIIGGMTYSEIRSVYEVNKDSRNWDVIIGSSSIITPKDFLNNLHTLGR